MDMEQDRLQKLSARFEGKRILVVGDCMLDEYLWGRASRISPEAPVMVVEQVDTSYAPGGASNVAANIVAMGGEAAIAAVVGDDVMGLRLRRELEHHTIAYGAVITDPRRPTTVKTRILAHNQQVLRVDLEDRTPISADVAAQLVEGVRSELHQSDAVLLADYNKGVLTEAVIAEVLLLARAAGKPVFANPKPPNVNYYRSVSLVSVNQYEAEVITGINLADLSAAADAGERLMRRCRAEAAMITLGSRGLALFQKGKAWCHLSGVPQEVYDPCGCGDSALAAATLARIAGAEWVEAAMMANLAGSAKVRKLGVVPVTCRELEAVWALAHRSSDGTVSHGVTDTPQHPPIVRSVSPRAESHSLPSDLLKGVRAVGQPFSMTGETGNGSH